MRTFVFSKWDLEEHLCKSHVPIGLNLLGCIEGPARVNLCSTKCPQGLSSFIPLYLLATGNGLQECYFHVEQNDLKWNTKSLLTCL